MYLKCGVSVMFDVSLHQGEPGLRGPAGPIGKTGPPVSGSHGSHIHYICCEDRHTVWPSVSDQPSTCEHRFFGRPFCYYLILFSYFPSYFLFVYTVYALI